MDVLLRKDEIVALCLGKWEESEENHGILIFALSSTHGIGRGPDRSCWSSTFDDTMRSFHGCCKWYIVRISRLEEEELVGLKQSI